MLFFSDLDRFGPNLGLARPVAENSSDRFLFRKVIACYDYGIITTFPSSSYAVTSICSGRCQTIFRALVTDSRSIENTRGNQPLWKPHLSCSGYSSRRLYVLLNVTSLTLSNTGNDRKAITSLSPCDWFLAVASAPSGSCRGRVALKAYLVIQWQEAVSLLQYYLRLIHAANEPELPLYHNPQWPNRTGLRERIWSFLQKLNHHTCDRTGQCVSNNVQRFFCNFPAHQSHCMRIELCFEHCRYTRFIHYLRLCLTIDEH